MMSLTVSLCILKRRYFTPRMITVNFWHAGLGHVYEILTVIEILTIWMIFDLVPYTEV
jgi:hypothetical protein